MLLACFAGGLLLFLGKAVHMDDPLFIWTARQIQSRWWDFYGYSVNWYGTRMRACDVIMNPPLTSVYLAGVAHLAGFSERALHAAMLAPTLGAVVGIYFLARLLCDAPLLATAIAAFSPVFFVSSTTLMSDVPMLCGWTWACVLWVHGVRHERTVPLAAASLLILIAALTKYFAATLVPLLLLYSLLSWRGWRYRALWLLIPVIGLLGYQAFTRHVYGVGLLGNAVVYSASAHAQLSWRPHVLSGLAFVGGGIATATPLASVVGLRRLRTAGGRGLVDLLVFALLMGAALWLNWAMTHRITKAQFWPPAVLLQLFLFSAAGLGVLALALPELKRVRDPDAVLLVCWMAGTFVFAVGFNWTLSARNILPMVPAVGILAVRAAGPKYGAAVSRVGWTGVVLLGGVSLWLAYADQDWADGAREAATIVQQRFAAARQTVWFQGHWGFQYYMQQHDARPVDYHESRCGAGDLMVYSYLNTNIRLLPHTLVRTLDPIVTGHSFGVTLYGVNRGVGFYSDLSGPLPFCFGPSDADQFRVDRLLHAVHYVPRSASETAPERR